MAKAHQPDLIGIWARENGFESIARNYHPQEREKRRHQALKRANEKGRRKEDQYTTGKRR
jgi:hypothetical protein